MYLNKYEKSGMFWVPTTYFMEGFPYILIFVVSSIMLKNLGVGNAVITSYTSLFLFPSLVMPFLAVFLDIYKSNRWWIYMTELLLALFILLIILALSSSYFFSITIALFFLLSINSNTHDMSVEGNYVSNLPTERQSFFLGFQSVFVVLGKFFSQGFLVILSGIVFSYTHNYFIAWQISLAIAAIVTLCLAIYHFFVLPERPNSYKKQNTDSLTPREGVIERICQIYKTFFQLEGIWIGLAFIVLYKLGELLVSAIFPLFLIDTHAHGGMGLSNASVGFAYGTVVVPFTIIAGLLGGYLIYKKGLKFWLAPMVLIMNVPHGLFIILAHDPNMSYSIVLIFIIIEKFCFTFAVCAYAIFMMYLIRNSSYKTSHFAFFSGFITLVQIPIRAVSGYIQELVGYEWTFVFIFLIVVPLLICVKFIKVDSNYGKKGA
ncbi:MFS transporter [Francisella sp. SYW-9]|uniref:MFS transporter n=1 Tax=Francisella sp. SYW-9 TaxID=2610888 RepID=UPI00123DC61A|nr:MFS transporter [Francisella sp. SYW-9]